MAVAVERAADRRHHPVQHPARRHDVRARLRVRDRDPPERLERLVVQHLVPVAQQPAVAVIRVLAQAHVRDDDELRGRVLQRANGVLHDPVLGEALEPERILRARDPEQERRLDPERAELARFVREQVDRELVDPRHGRDRGAHALAGDDEERVHQVVRRERRLAHEIAQRGRTAPPARAVRADVTCRSPRIRSRALPEVRHERLHDALRGRLAGHETDAQP